MFVVRWNKERFYDGIPHHFHGIVCRTMELRKVVMIFETTRFETNFSQNDCPVLASMALTHRGTNIVDVSVPVAVKNVGNQFD